jgi:hypothetical protein
MIARKIVQKPPNTQHTMTTQNINTEFKEFPKMARLSRDCGRRGQKPEDAMKTPFLLKVPKTGPSKWQQLQKIKRKHNILTHRSPSMRREDDPWIAIVPFDDDKGKPIWVIMAESCRLYDEAGQLATGQGELTTVRRLCEQLRIPCDL